MHGKCLAQDCIGQIGKTGIFEGIYPSFRQGKIDGFVEVEGCGSGVSKI